VETCAQWGGKRTLGGVVSSTLKGVAKAEGDSWREDVKDELFKRTWVRESTDGYRADFDLEGRRLAAKYQDLVGVGGNWEGHWERIGRSGKIKR